MSDETSTGDREAVRQADGTGGLASLSYGLLNMRYWHPAQLATMLVLAILAARLKLKLPGLHGNMSVYCPLS